MSRAYDGIQDFIAELEKVGELKRIREEVSPEIGISKITDAESKRPGGGKALFFENVKGSRFPVATNLFGSDKRMGMALGVPSLRQAGDELEGLLKLSPPRSFSDFFAAAKKTLPLLSVFPRSFRGKTAPCQEVVKLGADVDLSEIPVLKCWPKDAGRFVTLPLVFTKSADGRMRNLGMYRMQVFDRNTTGMHWHVHKDAAHFYHEYRAQNRRMEVAVAIGADPATVYSATAPMPRGADELMLAGFFRKKPVRLVKCKTVDLEVPADAEFVLEGYVDPHELRLEGPFGDHTGYYSLADMYPVFHVTAITRRERPVYCATLVGPPPMEDCYMAKATERFFLPLLKAVFPEISDYFLPWEGVFHNIAVVSMKKEYPAHAQKLISGLWGQGQMSFCKAIVAVDDDTDPSDLTAVWERLLENLDFASDMFKSYGVLDVLDHSSPDAVRGAQLGLDLTRRLPGESPRTARHAAETPSREEVLEAAGVDEAAVFNGFCALSMDKDGISGSAILRELAESETLRKFKAVAIFDRGVDLSDVSKMLWKVFNNTDPSRDVLVFENTAFVDACKKTEADGHAREWPDELSFGE